MRKCPSCNHTVSFWRVIKPGMFDTSHQHEVVCKNCSHVISRSWNEIGAQLLLLDLALPFILWQLNMSFKSFVSLLTALFIFSVLLAYFFIPFKDFGPHKK